MIYDIIIVGGGAVGLFLAKEFSLRGNSVLLLEKNKKIGQKACSGLVSYHIFDYIPKEDFDKFLDIKIEGAKLWIEKESFYFKGKALVLDREKFDNYLFEEAKKSGVDILLGKKVINVKEKKVIVEIVLEGGQTLKGKIIAGCDGVNSTIVKKCGFPIQKKFLLGTMCYEEKTSKVSDNYVELFFSKKFPGFFSWRIPRKKSVEWGLAVRKEKKPIKKLKDFLTEKEIKVNNFKGAFIPYFPLKKTAKGRVFLCGDSAGQIKPYTGGGIIYGFHCAKIAVKTISDFENPNLWQYEKAWRKSLMKEVFFGNFLKKCYLFPNFIKKIGLNFLKNRQKLDQDSPSSVFRF